MRAHIETPAARLAAPRQALTCAPHALSRKRPRRGSPGRAAGRRTARPGACPPRPPARARPAKAPTPTRPRARPARPARTPPRRPCASPAGCRPPASGPPPPLAAPCTAAAASALRAASHGCASAPAKRAVAHGRARGLQRPARGGGRQRPARVAPRASRAVSHAHLRMGSACLPGSAPQDTVAWGGCGARCWPEAGRVARTDWQLLPQVQPREDARRSGRLVQPRWQPRRKRARHHAGRRGGRLHEHAGRRGRRRGRAATAQAAARADDVRLAAHRCRAAARVHRRRIAGIIGRRLHRRRAPSVRGRGFPPRRGPRRWPPALRIPRMRSKSAPAALAWIAGVPGSCGPSSGFYLGLVGPSPARPAVQPGHPACSRRLGVPARRRD